MASFDIFNFGIAAIPCYLFLTWYIVSSIYNWQRLRHIPGPRLAAWSHLFVGKAAWYGTQYEDYLKLVKYGPIARVGPSDLITSDPEVIRHISSSKGKYNRGDFYDGFRFNPYHPTMFNLLEAGPHDKKKAKLTPGYSGRETSGIETTVDNQLANLVNLIRKKYVSGEGGSFVPMDLAGVIPLFTLDVISQLALGESFGCLKANADVHGFYSALGQHLPMMCLTTEVPWIRRILYSNIGLKLMGPKETDKKGLGAVMKMANEKVRDRYGPDAKVKEDLLGSFVKNGLTQPECEVETLFMFVAGSDTTAAAIKVTMLNLMSNSLAYLKLREEVHSAVRDGIVSSPITSAEAKTLPYLQAVLYEGLRVRPITTHRLSKAVPPGGEVLAGQFIPGGTSIGVNFAALMRSTALFGEDAHLFRPERFLEVDEATRAEMQRNVELNFGYGRWMCAGKPIAFMEINKTCFELLRNFDFHLIDPAGIKWSRSHGTWLDRSWFVRVTECDIKD